MIKIKIGNTSFHDSLLHLPGSLRSLAKDFCSGIHLEKGYFPHLFNTVANYEYVGRIPDKKYFDTSFVIKDEKEMLAFNEWYDSWQGREDWNFMHELKKYCINDVLVLSTIMKVYAEICIAKVDMNPWTFTTAPGFVHDMILRYLATTYELPDRKEDPHGYTSAVSELAETTGWCVLTNAEYEFSRLALRGGRTEIRKVYHQITDEEWARGERIRYQDICSQYPFQQAIHDFPTGAPTMYVWDSFANPCRRCELLTCFCGSRFDRDPRWKVVTDYDRETDFPDFTQPEWFGIVCVTLTPPTNLYHPVLVRYDDVKKKSIASCEKIVRGVFTSVEFQKALEVGYVVEKVHRFDKYNRTPSLWADKIKELYIEKMVNSGPLPSPEKQEELIQQYEERFEMGDMIAKTFREPGRWGERDAQKKVFKIMLNSCWGKHAQRPDLVETDITDVDSNNVKVLFQRISNRESTLKSIDYLGGKMMVRTQQTRNVTYKIHDSFLPAALFVPAYGRLQLWEQLNKLGKRVLMNDTDSIVYVYKPGEYNIPEGDVWGDWEVEKDDKKNGGIVEFVGLGPKTYGIRCKNGFTMVKAKGLSLKLAHRTLVNFEVMKNLVISHMRTGDSHKVQVPQMTFVYKIGEGMVTKYSLKALQFNSNDLKGNLTADGCLEPFGYSE